MSLFYFNATSDKKLINYLIEFYGISFTRAKLLIKYLGVDINVYYSTLNFEDKRKLDFLINKKFKYRLYGDLKKFNYDAIKTLRYIKCYKGIRHVLNLSVNGQNTKTNAKTQKWKRKK